MKVYLHVFNGNVQHNPLRAASCVPIRILSPLPGSLLRYFIAAQVQHSYTFVQQYALCAKLCIQNCSLEGREGISTFMYNVNVQQNPSCTQHPVFKLVYKQSNVFIRVLRECRAVLLMRSISCNEIICSQR